MKNISLIILFFIWTNTFFAQTGNPNTDALIDSAKYYMYSDKIKCYQFTAELKQKAIATNNKTALAYAYHFFGVIDENHGDNEAALKNYSAGLEYAEQARDTIVKLRILTALSNYYISLSKIDKCIKICHQGIKEATAIGNSEIASKFYNNLSIAYSHIKEYEKSLMYIDTSIQLKKELENKSTLANAYLHKGLLLNEMKEYDEGFKYYALAEELYLEYNTYHALTQTHINFAWDYTDLKQFRKAREHLEKALFFGEKSEDKIRQAGVWNALGYYYENIGYTDSVTYALEKGLQLSLEAENKRNTLVAYQELANHYQNTGNSKLALENLNKAYNLKDSIFEESKIQLAQSLNVRYETEQKEAENNRLKVENKLKAKELTTKQAEQKIIIISFIALLLFIFALAFYINYKRKIKAQKQLQQEEKLRFKAVIEAEEKERTRIAKELHDGLGQLLSTAKLNVASLEGNVNKEDEFLVKNASDLIDNAVNEVRSISHNMMPLALTQLGLISAVKELIVKMNDSGLLNVQFESNIETRLNSSIEIAIYRVIQEILNNIIKHAQAKEIGIQLTIENQRLRLQISDDGVGFNTNEIDDSKGIGWKSVFSRIMMLNGNIDVNSSKDKGTNLLISIPVNE